MVTAYVDSSVVLRWIFHAPDPYRVPEDLDSFASSILLRVECRRAIDRNRVTGKLSAEEAADCTEFLQSLIGKWTFLPITDDILETAGAPQPCAVATLDAIHLASAMHLKQKLPDRLIFVTHDRTQSTAARTLGLEVI